ncbi:hypothetical protein CR513_44228, partial [Mucuna pruriens]
MVKKASGKWRMCTNYTDLNKACPKDPYPFPNINHLVYRVTGYALLSFMDAYSGYNQIRIHLEDEEKTVFITDGGAFCYKVMPFGLKNARATYQRLMDSIFQDIMGVDVDGMVVKSEVASKHCKTIEQVFRVLRKHQLRLNPEKCSFGVQAGKFLGFMLTERGIEANPNKCRVTALSRFISRAVNAATPIFATLKRERNFTWTPEFDEAFLRLKAMLATPPTPF